MLHALQNQRTGNLKNAIRFILMMVLVLSFSTNSFSQTTVSFTTSGTANCSTAPVFTTSPTVTGLTVSNITKGSGVTCSTLSTGISGTTFNVVDANTAFAANKYYTFSITANATTNFTFSKFVLNTQTSPSGAGASVEVRYQINTGTVTAINSFPITTSGANYTYTPGSPISVPAGQVLNIYIVPFAAGAASGTVRVSNTTNFDVTTSAVTPTLTATPSTALAFGNQPVMVPSTSQTFNLSGSVLSPASGAITITAPSTDFEVSTDNVAFGPTATINYTLGAFTGTPVYVRFNAQSTGLKSGAVTFSGGSVSTPPTISVSGTGYIPATHLAVTSISPSTPFQNTSFSVTVESQDGSNITRNVLTNTNVTLSLATGSGILSGTLTGVIAANSSSVVITGVLYNTAESGVSVTATRTAGEVLTSGTSSTFTVAAPTSPTVTLVGTINPFTTTINIPSASQSYFVSGTNLVDNITLAPSAPFEISLNNSTWVTSAGTILLTQSGGNVPSTQIYVRYNPIAAGTNSGSVSHTSNTSGNPSLALSGTALAAEPTTSSVITFGAKTNNSLVVNFNSGNGTSRVLIAYTSPITFVPLDGALLTGVNANYGTATDQGGGNKAVYDGSSNTVTVTGLATATQYYFAIYEYNGTGALTNYYTASPGLNNTTTLAAEPATSTAATINKTKGDQFTLNMTGGSGPNRIVVVSAVNPVTFVPTDATTYAGANSDFSLATDQGSGNKIVYSGATVASVVVTGLLNNTLYNVRVYEFNGTTITTNYLTSTFGSANVTTPANIGYVSGTYTQNFDGLPVTGTPVYTGFGQGPYYLTSAPVSGTSLDGWQIANQANADLRIQADNGAGSTGSNYSYGTTASTERALGSLGATVVPAMGAVFSNNGTIPLSTITIAYTGELWRYGTDNNVLTFEYSLDGTNILNGTYTAVSALNLTAPVVTGALGPLDGNLAANQANISYTFTLNGNWLPGQKLVIRWKDVNDAGSDDGLAIDNFSFSAVGPQTPLVQDHDISFFNTLTNATGVTWMNGDGVNRIVKMNTVNSFTDPVDGATQPTQNTVYGGGEQVVYDGTGSFVNITNLTPSTQYYFRSYAYNGAGVATKFNTTTATGNPMDVTTAAPSFPTQWVVLDVNGGLDVVVNQPFTVTIQSQDNFGSPQNVTQNTTVDLSVFTGFGTLFSGNTTATINAGQNTVTITGVVYDAAEFNVILNVASTSGDILFDGQTQPFTVYDVAYQVIFVNTPANGVVGQPVNTFYVYAARLDNSTDPYYVGSATIAIYNGPGTMSGTLTQPFINGVATFDDISFSQVGTYALVATSGILQSSFSSNILINPPIAFTELVIPQYMGSKTSASANTDRTPIAVCFQIDNIAPNTTYNVAAGIGLIAEASTVLGAGSVWNGTAYSGQVRNAAFTTNANGSSGPVWIYIQPSGNASRFGGGEIHNVRIAYSSGTFGTIVPNFVTTKTITALDIAGTTPITAGTTDDGAFVTGALSACIGGKYILVYDNELGTGDPLYAYQANPSTPTQTTQSTLPVSVDQIFMGTSAAGTFAAVYPIGANSSNGIKRVEARNADNTIAAFASSATGIWPGGTNTTNAIRREVKALSNVDVSLSSITVSTSTTSVLCFGNANGSATATATSSNNPITYLWSPGGQTSSAISSQVAGSYTVTVSDGIGCTASASAIITQPSDIAIVSQVTNTGCSGGNTGAIDITVAGGTAPFSYLWSNSETTEDLTGLAAGTYSVIVTDLNGCSKSASYTIITQNTNPTITVTATPSTICAGETSTLEATGAATYDWSPATGLSATTGNIVTANPTTTTTYSVTAIDNFGCQSIGTVLLTINPLPIVVVSPSTAAICEGSSVSLVATGATTYLWSPSTGLNGTTTSTVIASPTTTTSYTVVGTDGNGCSASATAAVNVTNVSAPTATSPLTYCQNVVAPALTANASMGNQLWWYTTASGGNASAIAPIPSTATVGSTTYYVSQQASAPLSIAINGYLDNGTPDEYTFVALSRIPAGTAIYFTDNGWITGTGFRGATALDANGSEGFVRWVAVNTVPAGTVIRSAISTADYTWTTSGPINCSTCTGTNNYIPLDFAGGGDQIYAFTSTTTDNPLFNIAQQIHLAVFDDTNGFETATSTATGAVPPGLTAGLEANTFGFASANYVNLNNDGMTRSIAGWRTYIAASTNYTTGTGVNPGLPSTSLNVDLGCESPRTPITVNISSSPAVTATFTPILCTGGSSTVTVTATGGIAPYTGTGTFTVTAGTYTYTVTGSGGCSGTATITVTEPTPVVVTITETTTPCSGGTGSVTVTATGGTEPYTGTGVFTVSEGSVSYTVTDANGCTGSASATITANPNPTATVSPTSLTLCSDGSNSPSNLVVTTSETNILWNDPLMTTGSTLSVSYLDGTFTYVATVTNSFGCTATVSVPVTVASCASGITLTTKMFIEGYSAGSRDNYGSTGGFMDNGGGGGLLYLMGMSANPSDVDYVTVSLMDAVDYSEVATASGTLQADGMLIVQFPSASPGNYYIKLTHRNSIETWSAAAVTMTSTASYDFSSDVTQAFGDNMTEVSTGVWAIYSGDISDANNLGLGLGFQDGVVESQDYADMEAANAVNSGGYIPEDITGDGVVESTDYAIIEGNNSVNRGLQRPY